MEKTKMITAAIVVLAITVFAGEAIGQPGGRGRGGQGWGGGPGRGPGMTGGPQINADNDPEQSDNSWRPGPFCPWGQGPNQNIQPRQGRGPGGFGQGYRGPQNQYYPFGQGPNQNIRGRQGRGPRGFGQGLQGRGIGPAGRGFRRQDMITRRGPMAGRGGRGLQGRGAPFQGRGGRGFQRRNMPPQSRGMYNWQGQPGPGGRGGQGPRMRPQQFVPENQGQTNQPMLPRGRGWAPGSGQGWQQGQAPGWGQDWTPDWNLKPQPEKAPDANAPEPPIVEDQPEKPQGE